MNQGRTVFAQLVELLPRRAFENAVERYDGERRVRSFSCMDQLLCMIFAQVTGRASLRETVTCLRAIGPRCYPCPSSTVLGQVNPRGCSETRIFEQNQPRSLKT